MNNVLEQVMRSFIHKEFTNEHGEHYDVFVHPDGITVCLAGDETDGELMGLFNPEFNIWSKEELIKLADCIKEALNG